MGLPSPKLLPLFQLTRGRCDREEADSSSSLWLQMQLPQDGLKLRLTA